MHPLLFGKHFPEYQLFLMLYHKTSHNLFFLSHLPTLLFLGSHIPKKQENCSCNLSKDTPLLSSSPQNSSFLIFLLALVKKNQIPVLKKHLLQSFLVLWVHLFFLIYNKKKKQTLLSLLILPAVLLLPTFENYQKLPPLWT